MATSTTDPTAHTNRAGMRKRLTNIITRQNQKGDQNNMCRTHST